MAITVNCCLAGPGGMLSPWIHHRRSHTRLLKSISVPGPLNGLYRAHLEFREHSCDATWRCILIGFPDGVGSGMRDGVDTRNGLVMRDLLTFGYRDALACDYDLNTRPSLTLVSFFLSPRLWFLLIRIS